MIDLNYEDLAARHRKIDSRLSSLNDRKKEAVSKRIKELTEEIND